MAIIPQPPNSKEWLPACGSLMLFSSSAVLKALYRGRGHHLLCSTDEENKARGRDEDKSHTTGCWQGYI